MSEPVDGVDLPALVALVERELLGGPRLFTRRDVAERSDVDPEALRRLWRALGFASVGDDDRVFTDADLTALDRVFALRDAGDIDDDLMLAMTRIIGQSFARLASWQAQLVVEIIERNPDVLSDGDLSQVSDLIDRLIPTVSDIHNYVWRRQLAAVFNRIASNAGIGHAETAPTVVGFVDMAGFTTLTRKSSEAELRTVLTAFETLATDVVGSHGGQIVKTIGDEILFVCDDPVEAAESALELLESAAADPVLPQLRAGLAFGPVVRRLGDVYGQTVNIASRLTTLARTDTVLIDDGLTTALDDEDRFTLHSLRPTAVRGYRHLHSWRLRRAQA
jgi:adenylate cyclase